MVLERRVVDLDLDLARGAALHLGVVLERRPVEVELIALGEVLGGDPLVVLADERFAGPSLVIGQSFPDPGTDGVDELRLECRCLHDHLSVRVAASHATTG